MTEIKKPYVGVSGVATPEMQTFVEHEHLRSELAYKGRQLVVGVKATHTTQYLNEPNKYGPEWYPVGEADFNGAIRHEFPSPVTKIVAQAYFDVKRVGDASYRNKFLHSIDERGKPWLQGIQFDMLPWHNNDDMLTFLEHVKSSTELDVYLQAHGAAMTELGPKGITRRLGAHASLVDYVLFDASHGTGKRLNVEALTPFIEEAYEGFDPHQTGVAIAGGLSEEVVREELPALVEQYPDISWDAESQLHPMNADGKRPLDREKVAGYLRASSELFPRPPHDPNAVQRAVLDADFYWFGEIRKRAPFPHD
jgi:hypothetical protein